MASVRRSGPTDPIGVRDTLTAMLNFLIADGGRVCRIRTPYREHLAQHFAAVYSRIGLPGPYETQP